MLNTHVLQAFASPPPPAESTLTWLSLMLRPHVSHLSCQIVLIAELQIRQKPNKDDTYYACSQIANAA